MSEMSEMRNYELPSSPRKNVIKKTKRKRVPSLRFVVITFGDSSGDLNIGDLWLLIT